MRMFVDTPETLKNLAKVASEAAESLESKHKEETVDAICD